MQSKTIEGDVTRDLFGYFHESAMGLYLGTEMVESLFNPFKGKRVRVTIEVVEAHKQEVYGS